MKLPRDHHHRDLLEVENGIAATGHPDAARAAVTVMEQGGNAFDAIVAAGFTACVVEPLSCGIGGHGRLSARSAQAGRFITYDFQVRAPAAAHARMFGDPARPCEGAMAVGVPGLVAGLCAVHAELGTLPLPTIMAPAIACAERGYDFNWKDAMAIALLRDTLAGFPAAADLLLPGGKSPE
ncbi:MAG: gamma-glutamyltransferase, partial [Alphaproteobacteria bacterium]